MPATVSPCGSRASVGPFLCRLTASPRGKARCAPWAWLVARPSRSRDPADQPIDDTSRTKPTGATGIRSRLRSEACTPLRSWHSRICRRRLCPSRSEAGDAACVPRSRRTMQRASTRSLSAPSASRCLARAAHGRAERRALPLARFGSRSGPLEVGKTGSDSKGITAFSRTDSGTGGRTRGRETAGRKPDPTGLGRGKADIASGQTTVGHRRRPVAVEL